MSAERKAALRREMRAARLALAPETRERYANLMLSHAVGTMDWQGVQRVGSYSAVRGEADPAPLNAWLVASGKQVFLPIMQAGRQLRFARWEGQPLRAAAFGINEPELGKQHVAAAALDLLIVPLLGFDRLGTRLGAGAGYYDRALAGCVAGRPALLGLAYGFQQVNVLPVDPWDVPLSKVLTEHGVIVCDPSASARMELLSRG